MEQLLALRPISVWAFQAMLCESVCRPFYCIYSALFFHAGIDSDAERVKEMVCVCVVVSVSTLPSHGCIWNNVEDLFHVLKCVCLPPRVHQHNTHTHTHTHTRTGDLSYRDLEGQIGITLLHIWVHLTRAEELLRSSVWVFSRDLSFQSSEQLHTPNSRQQYHDLGIISSFFSLLAWTIKGFC